MHNHAQCISESMETAEQVCDTRKIKFTPLRRQVLEIVWRSHSPIGAYQVLDAMRVDDKAPAPPTVYRSLEFLLEQGFIHRIESLNAYIGCPHASQNHSGQFLICEKCGDVTEVHEKRVNGLVYQSAHEQGFMPKKQVLEVFGTCSKCLS